MRLQAEHCGLIFGRRATPYPPGGYKLLPPNLNRYAVSFVLHRGETSTAPHLGRFPPGPLRGAMTGFTGQSLFQPTQQYQSRVFITATGCATMRALVLPI